MTNLPAPVVLGLRSLVPSIVRTLVPVVVALLVRLGLRETDLDTTWLVNALTVVVTMGYYVAVRLLEKHWDKIGWLLGFPSSPVYVKGNVVTATEIATPPTTTTVIETDRDNNT